MTRTYNFSIIHYVIFVLLFFGRRNETKEVCMGWKNSRDFEAFNQRRSERYARLGRELEVRITAILQEMKEGAEIDDFISFSPHSPEDLEGKDFCVIKDINGKRVEKCFGVTISQRRLHLSKTIHSSVPQFCFPLVTSKHTMKRRIMELFAPPKQAHVGPSH